MQSQLIIKRLVQILPVLIGISVLTFVISHVAPGDPARVLAGPEARQEAVEQIRKKWGFDRPLYEQYFIYMGGLLQGDLGTSIQTRRPVLDDLRDRLPATAELGLTALMLTCLLGTPLGVIAAVRKDSAVDHASRVLAIAGVALPSFWIALIFQLIFYKWLSWLPSGGRLDQGVAPPATVTGMYIVDSLLAGNVVTMLNAGRHLILPATTLALGALASVARMARASMLEVLTKDYIRTAKAKGLRERLVIYRHALKNALIPVVTILGMHLGGLLGGAFIVEFVFYWPGVGYYGTEAIRTNDYSVTMGVALLLTLAFVLANLLTDIAYMFLDPRIRYA